MLPRGTQTEIIVFSAQAHLIRLFTHTIPALVLLFYFISKRITARVKLLKFNLKDLAVFVVTLLSLIAIGFILSLLSRFLNQSSARIEMSNAFTAFLIMIFSCIGLGYLEESFFRVYFVNRMETAGISMTKSVLLSALFFSLCHIYAGTFSVINAFLAAILLSFVYVKSKSFHGIALAHSAYNIFVHLM
jgi:membrane protease YdiL (CAAX protease family)